jgi:peroxiredoxin
MSHLQDTYDAYKEQDFVALGLNTADSEAHAREFLDGLKLTFPTVLDTSSEAEEAVGRYETLEGMTAVPLSYLIGKDGKILDAWYGYDKKKLRQVLLQLDEE